MPPQDLQAHNCINMRLPTHGIYAWEFEKGAREMNVRVAGQLAFNTLWMRLHAARAGLGILFAPEDVVQDDIDTGRFTRVPVDWCAPFPGYHLYYPSRRHPTPAFTLLVEALRFHRPKARSAQDLVVLLCSVTQISYHRSECPLDQDFGPLLWNRGLPDYPGDGTYPSQPYCGRGIVVPGPGCGWCGSKKRLEIPVVTFGVGGLTELGNTGK